MSALVVGIGNRCRGDDAVGLEVAARVAALALPDVEVVEHRSPLTMVERLGDYDPVVVVDATASRKAAGTVRVVRVDARPLRFNPTFTSSHGLGLAEAIELARSLGRLPCGLTVVGVEGADFEPGMRLSERVTVAVDEAVRTVVGLLAETVRR